MMHAEAKGFDEAIARVNSKQKAVLDAVAITMAEQLLRLAIFIQVSLLDGQLLNRRSGDLQKSITPDQPTVTDTAVYGRVWQNAAIAPYGKIQNDGGIIKHPGSSKLQAFQGATGLVVTHYTKPHDIPITGRQYMQAGLNEMRQNIINELKLSAKKAASA